MPHYYQNCHGKEGQSLYQKEKKEGQSHFAQDTGYKVIS